MNREFVVWFTGLPASGKSTLARRLERVLQERKLRVEVLDGEALRSTLSRDLGFTREDRDEHIRRIGFMSKLLSRNGIVAIVAAISPYRAARREVRRDVVEFVEVYVRCPVKILEARDPKGLYDRAVKGELCRFTGISDPYEEPLNPELILETDRQSEDQSLALIVARLTELSYLKK